MVFGQKIAAVRLRDVGLSGSIWLLATVASGFVAGLVTLQEKLWPADCCGQYKERRISLRVFAFSSSVRFPLFRSRRAGRIMSKAIFSAELQRPVFFQLA